MSINRSYVTVNTEVESTTLNAGAGAVANATRLGKLSRWIADILNDGTNGLAALLAAITGVDSTARKRQASRCQTFTKVITSPANALAVTVATVTTQPVRIESIILHSDGVTTTDLTSAPITGGASGVIPFLDATDAARANINAQDEQVSWRGDVYFPAGATIVITLNGTGATAVDLNAVIKYRATVDGGYLA